MQRKFFEVKKVFMQEQKKMLRGHWLELRMEYGQKFKNKWVKNELYGNY